MQRRYFLKSLAASLPVLKARAAGLRGGTQPIELAADGRSEYSICISRDASPSEIHGAQELQKFLGEISGATLPIVSDADKAQGNLVLVGNSRQVERLNLGIPLESLGTEGFMLKTTGNHLVIVGGRQRGTMYGVYTFLEKLGCRWFTPDVSRIPKLRRIAVEPLDEIQKPAFEYREPYFTESQDRDWAARNRMNGGMEDLNASTGGGIKYYPFVHSFYALVPPAKYFKDHPEYFALVDGKRRGENAQLCLTNPEVLRIAVARVFEWIHEHPEATIFSVSQNDSWGWCECDNCRRVEEEEGGAHSGPVLRFVNAVAAAVAPKYPDKLIDTLAYSYTQTAPAKARPLPNVRIRMCPIGACEAHPYEDCRYDAYIMKDLRDWAAMTHNLYIWHYVTNFSHGLRPYPDFGELAADIPMYRRNSVVGIFMEGYVVKGGGAENAELRSYVMARLLWDTRADVKRVIDEFHQTYYGKAAPAMLAYFNSLQRVVDLPPKGKGQHFWCCSSPHFSGEFLARARQLFGHAQAAAEDEAVRTRVEKARLPLDYLELNRVKKFAMRHGRYEPANTLEAQNRYQALMSRLERFGITDLVADSDLDSKEFPVRIKPYRVESLENASTTVHLAPELTGRIIQMVVKPAGENILLEPDPTDRTYPDYRGLGVFPYSDFLARSPMPLKWELASTPTANEWLLEGTGANGLRCHRRIQLVGEDPKLHTETTLENTGTMNLAVTLQSQIEINPGGLNPQDMDDVFVSFRRQDGTAVELKLIKPVEEPVGVETYTGTDQPDGELRMVNRRTGRTVISRFPKEQVARSVLTWTAKNQNRVTFQLWSQERTLKPGESLRLDADYENSTPHSA
jgi:Domain of unknown function (DUF4838)/Glycosyl hydrolase family 67 N-terminus